MLAIPARRLTVLLSALLALVACSPSGDVAPPPTTRASAPPYVIGPGDTLDIFVHQSPELSITALPVRPDGRLSIPLVPDIAAAGQTPSQLAREIEQSLRRYVQEPNVTIMVRTFQGAPEAQIRVIGEATEPRSMPYREGMTVLDVMINARGLTRYAAGNRAEIVRRNGTDGTRHNIRVRLTDLLRGGDMSQDLPMQPGDTLLIPQAWF